MSLVRFDLESDLEDLRREANQIFAMSAMPGWFSGNLATSRIMPAMDTYERDGRFCISLDVPGIDRDDIEVEVLDDLVTIRGSRSIDRERSDDTWYRHERSTGSFERSVRMPAPIDPDQVDAEFDKGVLVVTIPVPVQQQPERATVAIREAK